MSYVPPTLRKSHACRQAGFTFIELAVVLFIVVTLLGFITINLRGAQTRSYLSTSVDTFISDLKEQQSRAMLGDTQGSAENAYGVHVDTTSYTLFYGPTYTAGESKNFTINLDGNIQFTTPNINIVFSELSGETTTTTLTLKDPQTSKQTTIQVNSLGVVTAEN